MAYIILPHRWMRQPAAPLEIDPSSVLGSMARPATATEAGIAWAWTPVAKSFDLVSRSPCTTSSSGTVALAAGRDGVALSLAAGAVYSLTSLSGRLKNYYYPACHVLIGRWPAIGSPWGNIVRVDDGTNPYLSIQRYDTSSDLALFRSGTQFSRHTGLVTTLQNAGLCVLVVRANYFLNGWTNVINIGRNYYTATTNSGGTSGSGDAIVHLYGQAEVYGHYAFNFWPSEPAVNALIENPWQIFRPLQRRIYVPSAGGGAASEGAADITLGALTVTATGALPITGSAAITLDALTTSAAGALPIAGSASITLGDLTLTAEGALTASGTGAAAITLDALTVTATGTLPIAGSASITLGALTTAAEGVLSAPGTGQASITLAPLTVTATGTRPITGAGSIILGDLALSAAGSLAISGAASITLAPLALVAAGQQGVVIESPTTIGLRRVLGPSLTIAAARIGAARPRVVARKLKDLH
jgi:hypothetical protein